MLAMAAPSLAFISLPFRAASVALPAHHAASVSRRGPVHLTFSNPQPENPGQLEQAFSKLPGSVSTCILYLYLGSIVVGVVRLGRGLWQTHGLVRSAGTAELDEGQWATWEASQASMCVRNVKILTTSTLSSPATLYWPGPILLMPAKLERADSAEMNALFCHELAHVSRRDFIWNIAIEVFGVALFYHPAFQLDATQDTGDEGTRV